MKNVITVDSNSKSEDTLKNIFKDIRVFNPDTLLEDMLNAKEGTVFMLGEKHIPNHEGDDTVEQTFVQIKKARDTPSPEPSQDTVSMEDIMHATPKGRETVMKAIENSIEVQNKMTKKAQNTLKESNNLNTSEEHIKDTSLDDYFEDGFCGMCGTTTKDANRCHNCGIEIPSVVLSKTEVLQLFKQQQIKLIERIEGEVIGADRVTKDNVTKYARNKPEAGLINIYQDSLRRAQRQALKQLKDNVINGGSL